MGAWWPQRARRHYDGGGHIVMYDNLSEEVGGRGQ